jgi:PGF-pre-PGF domain-containing protein
MGPSPSSSPAISTQSNWQVTLTPGSVSVLNFSNPILGFSSSLSLSEMDINVNQTENTNVFVTQYYNTPTGIPTENSGQVYQYLQISLSNSTNVQQANLIFKVNKSWISSNNLNQNNISIYKLDNSTNNQWMILPTTYNGADANFYYYQTSVNSFSYFAIIVLPQQAANSGNTIPNGTQQQSPVTTQKENLELVLILILVVILIAIFIGKRRKKK